MIAPKPLWLLLAAAHLGMAAPVNQPAAPVDLSTIKFEPGKFVTLVPAPQGTGAPAPVAAVQQPPPQQPQVPAGANDPGATYPGANTLGAKTPGANTPGANNPGANNPGANNPGANTPGTNTPGANAPGNSNTGASNGGIYNKNNPDTSGIDWVAARRVSKSLITNITHHIQNPDPAPETHLNATVYATALAAGGLTAASAAKLSTNFPVTNPSIAAFIQELTGSKRPLGPDAKGTLYVHQVSIQPALLAEARTASEDKGATEEDRQAAKAFADKKDPIFDAMVHANKEGGALVMIDYDAEGLRQGLLVVKQGAKPLTVHQHLGAAAESYAGTGNPFPVRWVATSARVVDDDEAREALGRVTATDDWKVKDKPDRYLLSMNGQGEEGEHFEELGATFVGQTMLNALADYHTAFGDSMPVRAHIYADPNGKENCIMWELEKTS